MNILRIGNHPRLLPFLLSSAVLAKLATISSIVLAGTFALGQSCQQGVAFLIMILCFCDLTIVCFKII
ncbi:hypothetical protein PMAYCL1PPCAC_09204, partial [Pristionchus mayeri]